MTIRNLARYFLIFIICTATSTLANHYAAIDYLITPVLTSTPYLQVTSIIKGDLAGKITIDFPYIWANTKYYQQIKNIKLLNPPGNITVKKHHTNQAIITVPQTKKIIFSYEIRPTFAKSTNLQSTIVQHDLVSTTGYGIFAIPSALNYQTKINVNIYWENIPKTWHTLSSHGNTKSMQLTINALQLQHAFHTAGKIRVYQLAHTHPIHLSLYGNFTLPDSAIITILKEIIKTQRAFFNDHDFPYYAISLIQTSDRNFEGINLSNSFIAYLPQKLSKFAYYNLLAHEHLHNWIGNKISNPTAGASIYWWTEGFTVYYSKVLALRSGGISLEEFTTNCNKILKNYYLSPELNAPNKKIIRRFWQNIDIYQIPYLRGFMFAVYLNYLIKKNNPAYSLDNVMLDLFKIAEQKEFSLQSFAKIAKKYIPQGITQELSRFINQGKTIELNNITKFLPITKITSAPKQKTIYQLQLNLPADKSKIRSFFSEKPAQQSLILEKIK